MIEPNGCGTWFSSVLPTAVSIAASAVTAGVAIVAIRRAAEEQRVTTVHALLVSCLTETLDLFRQQYLLLVGIAGGLNYRDRRTGVEERAFDRFVSRSGELSSRFGALTTQHEMLLPFEAFREIGRLVASFNKCADTAYRCKPDANGIYPDLTNELEQQIDAFYAIYGEALEVFRRYVGSNQLEELGSRPSALMMADQVVERP